MKKLTVAIPTFNGGQNLERAIKSCEKIQILPDDYEILVIDNCSTDNSISNINKLKKEFSKFKISRKSKKCRKNSKLECIYR